MYRAWRGRPGRGLSDSGKRIHAAGRILVAPERKKLLAAAHRAQIRRVNVPPGYAEFFELPAIGVRQVDVPSSLPSEPPGHLRAHLVAALPDARADSRMQVFGARSEAPAHGGDGFRRDPRHGDRKSTRLNSSHRCIS